MKRIGVFILCLVLVGCADKGPSPELEEKDSQLARMQERLVEVQQASSSEITALQTKLAEANKELAEESDQQSKLVQLLRKQVDQLREENRQLLLENSRPISPPPPPPPEAPSFKHLEAAVEAATEDKPAFPVRVTKLEGRKVITGTHNVTEFVPSEETYKDKYGRIRQDGEWIDKPVNQYGYEIIYTMVNDSDQQVQLTARAGLASERMTLTPGETRFNARLVAARGSELWLMSDGKSMKINVEYQDEDSGR